MKMQESYKDHFEVSTRFCTLDMEVIMKKLLILYTFLWFFSFCCGHTKMLTVVPITQGLRVSLHTEYKQALNKAAFKKLFDKLIVHPKMVLDAMSENIVPFINHPGTYLDYTLFRSLTKLYPLCFLSECRARECLASRANSSLREQLEHDVIKKVKEQYGPEQELIYVSFGCGYLFTDCVILTKLVAAGYKNIKIHLIDKMFSEYIQAIKMSGETVSTDSEDVDKKKQSWLRAQTYRLATFLSWMEHCVGKKVELSLYDSVKGYLCTVEQDPCCAADIITGVDYFESPNVKAIRDFNKLALIGAKDKGLVIYLVSGMSIVQAAGQSYLEKIAAYGTLVKKVALSYTEANKLW